MDDCRQSVSPLSAWSRSASPGGPRPCRDLDTRREHRFEPVFFCVAGGEVLTLAFRRSGRRVELDVVHHFTVDDAGWFVRYRSFHDSARYAAAYRGTPPA